ncbi:phosphoprotein phosphatase, putative, partial [Leishmania donovani]
MAERPSTLAISEAKTSNRLPDPLRSPTDRTREHLLSNRSFSSVLEAVAGGTSLSSTPDFQEEEGVQHKRTFDFFGATPHSGEFLPLIEWLLRRGERGDVGAPTASQKDGDEYTQASFFNEDYIMKLCAAATAVLVKEPTLLELEVVAHDTLVVVGDIHGQFQDLYTSVLCQQYDRRR